MRPSKVREEMEIAVQAKKSVFIHGDVGIGKSSIVAQFAEDQGPDHGFIDLRASQLDPVDARGIPNANKETRTTEWFPPNFLPTDGEGTLFLDELNKANQDTQAALYQLILDGRLGDYIKPEGWNIIAAGNRAIDGSFVQPMARALKNRFIHLYMEAHHGDFITYAVRKDFDERVIAFIRARPELLNEATAAAKDESGDHAKVLRNSDAFGTPRSWEFTSDILKVGTEHGRETADNFDILVGTIGEGCSGEFVSYCNVYMDLPDLDEMVKNPSLFQKTSDPNKLYAICTGIAARVEKDNFKNIIKIINKMDREYASFTIDDCMARAKDVVSRHPAYLEWVHENIDYL